MKLEVHPSLVAAMRQALLGEIGARSIYAHLARRTRDAELCEVLARLHEEECAQVEDLRRLMAAIGTRTRHWSARRSLTAWLVSLSTHVGGMQLALRLCVESEVTIGRWYREYAHYLAQANAREHVATCEALALTKERHARMLTAWVDR